MNLRSVFAVTVCFQNLNLSFLELQIYDIDAAYLFFLLFFFFVEREREYYSLAVKIPFTIDETIISAMLTALSNGLTMMLPLTKAAYNHLKTYADFTTERFPTGISRVIYGKSCLKVDIIGLCVQ